MFAQIRQAASFRQQRDVLPRLLQPLSVETADRLSARAQNAGMLVGDQTAFGAQITRPHLYCIERRFGQGCQARVGFDGRVAVVTIVGILATTKVAIMALAGELVEALNRLLEPCRANTELLGKFLKRGSFDDVSLFQKVFRRHAGKHHTQLVPIGCCSYSLRICAL